MLLNRSQSIINDDYMPDNDDDGNQYIDQEKVCQMDEEQRKQFEIFMSTSCLIPQSHIKEVVSDVVKGQCRISDMSKILIGQAAKLFAAELKKYPSNIGEFINCYKDLEGII